MANPRLRFLSPWIRPWFVLLAALPLKAAHDGADFIVLVADSRRFSGARAWWANVYNEGHTEFTLLTIIIIPLLGLVMANFTGYILSRMGVNIKSRVLAEH